MGKQPQGPLAPCRKKDKNRHPTSCRKKGVEPLPRPCVSLHCPLLIKLSFPPKLPKNRRPSNMSYIRAENSEWQPQRRGQHTGLGSFGVWWVCKVHLSRKTLSLPQSWSSPLKGGGWVCWDKWWRVFVDDFPEDQSSIPSTHSRGLAGTSNSSSRTPDALAILWTLHALKTQV